MRKLIIAALLLSSNSVFAAGTYEFKVTNQTDVTVNLLTSFVSVTPYNTTGSSDYDNTRKCSNVKLKPNQTIVCKGKESVIIKPNFIRFANNDGDGSWKFKYDPKQTEFVLTKKEYGRYKSSEWPK